MTLSNMPPGVTWIPGDWDKDISYTAGVIIRDVVYLDQSSNLTIDELQTLCIKNTIDKINNYYLVKFNSDFKILDQTIVASKDLSVDELEISYEFLAEVEGDTTVDLQYGDDQVERDIIMDITTTLSDYGLDDITIIDHDINIDYH